MDIPFHQIQIPLNGENSNYFQNAAQNPQSPNPNPNIFPSLTLYQYCVSIGSELRGLEMQKLQLLEAITEAKDVVDGSPYRSMPQVNALKSLIDLYTTLTNIMGQIAQQREISGICLSPVMQDNFLLIGHMSMMNEVRKIYDLGWRGTLVIPSHLNVGVITDLTHSIAVLAGLHSMVIDLIGAQQQNVGQ